MMNVYPDALVSAWGAVFGEEAAGPAADQPSSRRRYELRRLQITGATVG
jgi:hypothetical protein